MRKHHRFAFVPLCVSILLCLLSGCLETADVQLTEEQEAQIDLIVQHRDEWKETQYSILSYPVNRLHISEVDGEITVLTVAYVEDGTGLMEDTQIFVGVKGYAVTDGRFFPIDRHHEDWIVDCVSVDLENTSDEKLREIIKQSYTNFLSKE